jgi:hypothetical protein
MKNDNYKYFKEGDYIVCIKDGPCVFPNLFDDRMDGVRSKLCKTYIVDRYLRREDGGIIYDALVLKGYTPLHDGKNFMLLSEFRKMKLNKLKRRLFFKKTFRKFGFVK